MASKDIEQEMFLMLKRIIQLEAAALVERQSLLHLRNKVGVLEQLVYKLAGSKTPECQDHEHDESDNDR